MTLQIVAFARLRALISSPGASRTRERRAARYLRYIVSPLGRSDCSQRAIATRLQRQKKGGEEARIGGLIRGPEVAPRYDPSFLPLTHTSTLQHTLLSSATPPPANHNPNLEKLPNIFRAALFWTGRKLTIFILCHSIPSTHVTYASVI